jgi:hypothetical protein
MWPKILAGSCLALVPPSTHMPQWTHRGWPKHYPIIHPWSEVRYHPTRRHMKLLSLGIPYVPYALVHFKCLFIRTQPTRSLIDTGGGYHLGALNIRSDHSPSFHPVFSIFPSLPHLVSNYENYSTIMLNHIGPPSIERALSWVDSNHLTSTDSLYN